MLDVSRDDLPGLASRSVSPGWNLSEFVAFDKVVGATVVYIDGAGRITARRGEMDGGDFPLTFHLSARDNKQLLNRFPPIPPSD
jgi:hypothetical protein